MRPSSSVKTVGRFPMRLPLCCTARKSSLSLILIKSVIKRLSRSNPESGIQLNSRHFPAHLEVILFVTHPLSCISVTHLVSKTEGIRRHVDALTTVASINNIVYNYIRE